MTTISAARAISTAHKSREVEAYNGLVLALADDVEIAPEDVIRIVEAAGRTFDQLEADRYRIEHRRKSAGRLMASESATREASRTEQAIAKVREEIAAAVRAGEAKIATLNVELLAHVRAAELGARARRDLLATAPPELSSANKLLLVERAELVARREAVDHAYQSAVKGAAREVEHYSKQPNKSEHAARLATAQQRAAAIVQPPELVEIDSRLTSIDAEIEANEQQKLVP